MFITHYESLDFDTPLPMNLIFHPEYGDKLVLPHWHPAIEFAYIAKGHPGTALLAGQSYELSEDSFILIDSNLLHSFNTYLNDQNRILTILLPQDWLTRGFPADNDYHFKTGKFELKDYPELRPLLADLKDFSQQTSPVPAALYRAIGSSYQLASVLLRDFLETASAKMEKQEIPLIIQQTMIELQLNYGQEISIGEIATTYNFSPAYFSKYFKSYVGMAPKIYLNQVRLEAARKALLHSKKMIGTIALESGFGTEKNFFVMFKKHFHCTPAEFRHLSQKNNP